MMRGKNKVAQAPGGRVLWITGLSGSGKTTLAVQLTKDLRHMGHPVIVLDGDEIREVLGVDTALYTKKDRLNLGLRYGKLSQILARQGAFVIVATISMFSEVYEWNRNNLPNYTEIFLDVPLDELKRRDIKNIYKRAELGEIKNVAGVDLPVEPPRLPDIHIRWEDGQDYKMVSKSIIKKVA